MKRLSLFISLLFICTIAIADTETINWYVDGISYAQTTCEIGNNIDLPTAPVKRGYTFTGWSEIFSRGTWAKWENVPTSSASYPSDANGNKTPLNGDYMTVLDASDYVYNFIDTFSFFVTGGSDSVLTWTYNGISTNINASVAQVFGLNDSLKTITNVNINIITIAANKPVRVNGRTYDPGEQIYKGNRLIAQPNQKYVVDIMSEPGDYTGSWRFIYTGTWATDGKYGWVPKNKLN